MQEEVENRTVNLMISTTKLTWAGAGNRLPEISTVPGKGKSRKRSSTWKADREKADWSESGRIQY